MATKNKVLMSGALESLEGKWWLSVLFSLIFVVFTAVGRSIPMVGWLVGLLIGGPLYYSATSFFIGISRGKEEKIEKIFEGFKHFTRTFLAYFFILLFTFLWSLLLIVPGIIAAISYAMTFYIMVDDQEISAMDAIDKSKEMMQGYKWKFFCLGLRFIGWALLAILTLGIGFFWLIPYMKVTAAKFYDDIKNKLQRSI